MRKYDQICMQFIYFMFMFTECFGNKVSLLLSITHYCFRNMLLEAWMNLCWHFKNHNKIWWTAQERAYHENNWTVGFITFHEEIFCWPAAREIISTHSMSTESSLSEKSRLQLNQIRNIIELKCGLWTWRYHSWSTRIMFQTVSKRSLHCYVKNWTYFRIVRVLEN